MAKSFQPLAVLAGVLLAAAAIVAGWFGYFLMFKHPLGPIGAFIGSALMSVATPYLVVRAYQTLKACMTPHWRQLAADGTSGAFADLFEGCGGLFSAIIGIFLVIGVGSFVFGGIGAIWAWATKDLSHDATVLASLSCVIIVMLVGIYVRLGTLVRISKQIEEIELKPALEPQVADPRPEPNYY